MTRPAILRTLRHGFQNADAAGSCGGRCPLGRGGTCSGCVADIPVDRVGGGSRAGPVWALGSYAGDTGRLVRALKYGNVRGPVVALGSALAGLAVGSDPVAGFDVVTWVPTTVERRARAGSTRPSCLPSRRSVVSGSDPADCCYVPPAPARRRYRVGPGARVRSSGHVGSPPEPGSCSSMTWSRLEPASLQPPTPCLSPGPDRSARWLS